MKHNKLEQLTEAIRKEVTKVITEAKKGKKKKMRFEGISVQESGHVDKDDVGAFWIVLNPTKGSTDENIMFETDIFNFSEKLGQGGLTRENIKGIFKTEDRAKRMKGKLLRERQTAISDAKNSAEKLKGLRDEVVNKAQALKQTKLETQDAVRKINENKTKRTK